MRLSRVSGSEDKRRPNKTKIPHFQINIESENVEAKAGEVGFEPTVSGLGGRRYVLARPLAQNARTLDDHPDI